MGINMCMNFQVHIYSGSMFSYGGVVPPPYPPLILVKGIKVRSARGPLTVTVGVFRYFSAFSPIFRMLNLLDPSSNNNCKWIYAPQVSQKGLLHRQLCFSEPWEGDFLQDNFFF